MENRWSLKPRGSVMVTLEWDDSKKLFGFDVDCNEEWSSVAMSLSKLFEKLKITREDCNVAFDECRECEIIGEDGTGSGVEGCME